MSDWAIYGINLSCLVLNKNLLICFQKDSYGIEKEFESFWKQINRFLFKTNQLK